jgi:hypothetical protein
VIVVIANNGTPAFNLARSPRKALPWPGERQLMQRGRLDDGKGLDAGGRLGQTAYDLRKEEAMPVTWGDLTSILFALFLVGVLGLCVLIANKTIDS